MQYIILAMRRYELFGCLQFLPRDANATREPAVLAVAWCLSVRPSVTWWYCVETAQRIELFVGNLARRLISAYRIWGVRRFG